MEKIKHKEKDIIMLKVKYDRENALLEGYDIIVSGFFGGVSMLAASGSNHRVRKRMGDAASSDSSFHK